MDRQRRRARQEIIARCGSGLDARTLFVETTRRMAQVVDWDRACWHTVDPATLLFTSAFAVNLGPGEPRLPVHEYEIDDVNKWAYLARRPWPVGLLRQATHGHPDTSPRFRELLRPRGVGDELRASLVADGRCWGFSASTATRAARSSARTRPPSSSRSTRPSPAGCAARCCSTR